jgi:hypothetical protein
MWPQDRAAWLAFYQGGYADFLGEDERETYTRLRQYPPLTAYARRIARGSAQDTRVVLEAFHAGHDDLFTRADFGRWLRTTTWRNALRRVLNPEPVERVLCSLPQEQRRLLQWRYFDHLHDIEVAKLLDLPASGSASWNPAQAATRSTATYRSFVALLQAAFPAAGDPLARREHASFFPIFLGGVP